MVLWSSWVWHPTVDWGVTKDVYLRWWNEVNEVAVFNLKGWKSSTGLNVSDNTLEGRVYRISDRSALEEALADFFGEREEVIAAYLYGSLASGDTGHDLDVGVFVRGDVDFLRLGTLLEMHLFGVGIKVPVDLRTLNDAPIWVQYKVIKEGIRVHESSHDEVAELEARIVLEYLDFKPMLEAYDRAFWERVLGEVQRRTPKAPAGDGACP